MANNLDRKYKEELSKSGLEELWDFLNLEELNKMNDYSIYIGIVSEDSDRSKQALELNLSQDSGKKGINNAELLFIHENGSPMRGLLPRPILEKTRTWAYSRLDNVLHQVTAAILDGGTFEKEGKIILNRFCERITSYVQDTARQDGFGFHRLKDPTRGGKNKDGDAIPLLDTSNLVSSISAYLGKKTE